MLYSEQTVRATGLVIALGFIALYLHGQYIENCRAQVRNGTTKALELEICVEASSLGSKIAPAKRQ